MKTLACTFAALSCALAAGAASAETARAAYGDLDLSQPTEAQVFARRVAAAARSACDGPHRGDIRSFPEHRRCVAEVSQALVRALPAAERVAFARAERRGSDVRTARALADRGARLGL